MSVAGRLRLRLLDGLFRHELAALCATALLAVLAARLLLPAPGDVAAHFTGIEWFASPPIEPARDAEGRIKLEPPNSVQQMLRERAWWQSAMIFATMFAMGGASLLGAEFLMGRAFSPAAPRPAAWGAGAVLIALVAMYGLQPLSALGYERLSLATELPDYDPAHPTVPVQLGTAMVAGLAVFVVAACVARGRAALGLVMPASSEGLLAVPFVLLCGMAFPIALVCASVVVHTLLGIDVAAQGAAEAVADARGWQLLAVAAYLIVAAPLIEEVLFRGLLTGALERRCRPLSAAALTAAIFALCHDASVMLPVFGTGYLLGLLRARTGGLAAPFVLHASYNALMVALTVAAGTAKAGG